MSYLAMKQEDKQLLFKDLCARLPYNVAVRCTDSVTDYNCFLTTDILHEIQNGYEYYDYKPYLRPMSSMTEEEKKEFQAFHCVDGLHPYFYQQMCNLPNLENMMVWLNKHHFDYIGLIKKGLALEAPEYMYKTE